MENRAASSQGRKYRRRSRSLRKGPNKQTLLSYYRYWLAELLQKLFNRSRPSYHLKSLGLRARNAPFRRCLQTLRETQTAIFAHYNLPALRAGVLGWKVPTVSVICFEPCVATDCEAGTDYSIASAPASRPFLAGSSLAEHEPQVLIPASLTRHC